MKVLTFKVANKTIDELRILLKAKNDFILRVSYKIEGKSNKVKNIIRLKRKVFRYRKSVNKPIRKWIKNRNKKK